jgi:cell division protein FtsB
LNVFELQDEYEIQVKINQKLKKENGALLAEVNDLKSGTEAVEERARDDLGMIKKDEIFFEVIKTQE